MEGPDAPLVLVTGFGPYPKVRVNPTATLARAVAGSPRLRRLGLSARAHVFETSYAAAGAQAPGVIAAAAPVACLHLGLAPRERMLRVETRGENRTRALSPDVRGNRPALRALRPGSPAALRSAAPLGAILAALRRAGLKARLSNDAGAYLCNAMYFWSLDEARASGARRPVVFVHLPRPAPAPGTLPRRRRKTVRPTDAELTAALVDIAIALARAGRR
ncbi:peptidase C15 [Alsobacter sp. SYSU M60028]|uniref:Pyroglutamyl-peptidase I n=1 Tax=Alsobacter ponti TaxID=2962936 RepID=A0ABT1LC52_9HYPH|nr:peptidase C15 [Alsobacter ponti]MCP8937833.1 peptidase C15 [Alsobacter ponti]